MLLLHPVARIIAAILTSIAALLAHNALAISLIHLVVLAALLRSELIAHHFRFVLLVTTPLLVALVIIWGWIADSSRIPPSYSGGLSYALVSWLRIVILGGVLQWLFMPLVQHPAHLRDFLQRAGLSGSIGTLIVASVIFLPEMQRRATRIVDARKAQGYQTSGLRAVREVPSILMPLVSSLLDSANQRAELWTHRGILERSHLGVVDANHSWIQSATVIAGTLLVCIVVVLT